MMLTCGGDRGHHGSYACSSVVLTLGSCSTARTVEVPLATPSTLVLQLILQLHRMVP